MQSPLHRGIAKGEIPCISIDACTLKRRRSIPDAPSTALTTTSGDLTLLVHIIVGFPKEARPVNSRMRVGHIKFD